MVVIGLSTEENEQQVLLPQTTGNKKKFNIDYAVFLTNFVDFYINFTLQQ